jgi:hypothetical protein
MAEEDIEGVTVEGDRAVERIGQLGGERSSALAKLFETDELLGNGPPCAPGLSN